MELYRTKEGGVVSIGVDEFPVNPREWDNLGKFSIKSRDFVLNECEEEWFDLYSLAAWEKGLSVKEAHEFIIYNSGTYYELGEISNQYSQYKKNIGVILPVYKYEHSGILLNTTGFSCPWDSGQIGYIFAFKDDIRRNFQIKRVTERYKEKTEEILRAEVSELSAYWNGDCYYIQLFDSYQDYLEGNWSDSLSLNLNYGVDIKEEIESYFGVTITSLICENQAA